MIIKEIIDMTKEKPIAIIARDHLEIGEKKLREILKDIGGQHQKGQRGWTFEGNPEDQERSIYDFVQDGRKAKATTKEQPNKITGETSSITTGERSLRTTGERSQQGTKKRASFDIDVEALKKIKIHAIEEDMKISEIVEIAIFSYIEQNKI
jgi:hypothetical protein